VWGLAISLAKENVEKRLPEVVNTVAGRLVAVERYEAAGELYEDINAMKEVSIHAFTMSSRNFKISIGVVERSRGSFSVSVH
jgi:hypothetical protein